MALGLTQPLTEMNTRNISWGKRRPVRRADKLTTFMCRLSWNLGASTSWNPQGLSRPVMGLLYFYLYLKISFVISILNLGYLSSGQSVSTPQGCEDPWLFWIPIIRTICIYATRLWGSVVILGTYHPDNLYLLHKDVRIRGYFGYLSSGQSVSTPQGCEDPWLFWIPIIRTICIYATRMWGAVVILDTYHPDNLYLRHKDVRIRGYFSKPKGAPRVKKCGKHRFKKCGCYVYHLFEH